MLIIYIYIYIYIILYVYISTFIYSYILHLFAEQPCVTAKMWVQQYDSHVSWFARFVFVGLFQYS